jgi:hypothetical protein
MRRNAILSRHRITILNKCNILLQFKGHHKKAHLYGIIYSNSERGRKFLYSNCDREPRRDLPAFSTCSLYMKSRAM